MKHNILKSLFISVILLAGTSNVWGAESYKGFYTDGQWDVQYWNGSSDQWIGAQNNASTCNLGIQTTLWLKNSWVKTWSNNGWKQSEVIWYWGWNNNYNNNWKAYKSNVEGNQHWDFDINDYDMIGNAPNNPGHNTLYMYWRLDNYVSTSASYINFTIPGFTTTSASQTFDNTTVGSNRSKTISFGTHYGTTLTTTNCAITGTNASEFSVTSINESSVTVQFKPTSAGNKTATLTITDAHSKECTITLSGKTQYTVTYSKGNYGTGNNITDNKVYGTALTLKDKGNFTREHYTQTAWNTNANGTGGTSYALEASYTQEAELQLYPTWTPIEYKITYNLNGGENHASNPDNYTIETPTITLQAPTKAGYTFDGWYSDAEFTGEKVTTIAKGTTGYITLYAKWEENLSTITIVTKPANGGTITVDGQPFASGSTVQVGINTTKEVTAVPNTGYGVAAWGISGSASVAGNTTVTLKGDGSGETGTLYANFTPITYNITYHLNGGENHASNPDNYTIETSTITLQAPTKNRYTFDGWYSDAEFTGEKVTTITKGTTGNIELYAKWSETKYSVNINTNNRNWGITTPSGANWVGATPVNLIATHHTGYHFVNWTATGGARIVDLNSPTTTITATASGTVTAHFAESLYDITVKSSNSKYGTVEQSAPKAGVSTAITITADPIEGFEFTGWSKDGDITIASINSATTTLTATGAGTVTANFAPKGSTPIYFKANHRWKQAGARFAVYYWNNNGKNGWDNMEEICGEDYYKAEVPAGYTGFMFVRLNPNNQTNSTEGGAFWNKTVDIVTPTDGKTMYDAQKVYFRPNNEWKTDNARFAAYFYIEVDGKDTEHKWMSLLPTETDGLYWCDLPMQDDNGNTKYYNRVIFCRMEPANATNNWDNRWNEAKTQDVLNINCFTIDDGQWGKGKNHSNDDPATGYWSLINDEATYNVTLYSCSFGEYGFIYNNVEYTSPESGNITYQIPINATVKVFSRPYSKEYRGDVMVNQSGTKWEITPDNPLLNITCNTILDDNYKTTGEHEVYLAIPNNGGSWVTDAATLHYLYAFHSRTDEGEGIPVAMTEVGHADVELNSQYVDHIYYRCVIPAEVNTIRFEKRSNATTTVLSTIDLRYDIPLNSVNCYRLDRKGNSNQSYAGVWEQAPGFGSDFRLVHYRKANVIYYSDIIRHGTISQVVSLHISTEDANAEYSRLELQQQNANGEWVTVSGQTKLVKDINKIMNDQQDNGCGVWNFTVITDGADKAEVNFDIPKRYTGNYYIRTNNAEGEWRNYTLSTNHMTFSSYAKTHSGYTHYYCRYVDLIDDSKVPGHNKNVKFIIANDYAANLSNEMIGDVHTTSGSDYTKGGDLPESANVRWTWNEIDNSVSRAYILGSHAEIDHIVATATNQTSQRLKDQENWIYEIDLTGIKQGDKLNIHADYPSKDIGTIKKTTQTFADNLEMIKTDDSNPNSYTVRVMYDFKINKTLIMLCPDQINGANIGVDVFIDRLDQGEASQVKPGATVTSSKDEGYTVYSTLTLTKNHLLGNGTEWERLYYWISFPFDVRISEIFGFGEYGKHYIIEYYDGAARAENGCWADSPTYWRQITDTTYSARREADNQGNEDANGNPNNGILVANKGYVLALARNIAKSDIFKYGNDYVRLYFPSRKKITSIDADMQETTVYLRPHTCNITRENRYIYDSNWHIIGVPSYANKAQTLKEEDVLYFYTYKTADNSYNVTPAENALGAQTITFNSMHAYMVQYAGYVNWKSWLPPQEPQSVVARRQSAETQEDYALRLELQRDGQYADQAFVQLKAEGATADFDINQDLTKIINAGANIYTLAGEKRIQVAGNVLPIAKTTIPVGIQVAQVGTYTIALPDGTSGISATLVDNQTGTHTNLLLEGYTITLDAGSHENRFYIVLDPERSATAVENIGDVQGDKTQKFLIDGQLIIRTDQGVYDATGGKVK